MMGTRYILLVFFIVQISFCAVANRKADSLINIVHEYEKKTHFESDTNYIKALIDVSERLKNINPDSSLLFGNKAYELSTRNEYHRGIIKSGLSVAQIYLAKLNKNKLIEVANGMMSAAEKTDRKVQCVAYNMLGVAYLFDGAERSSLYQAKEIFQKALDVCREYNDTVTTIKVLSNLSAAQVELYDYVSAIECLYQAIGLAERVGMQSGLPVLYHNLANLHYTQKNYDKAIVEQNKGIELAEKSNEVVNIITGMRLFNEVEKK